jgi:Do/DeqQ family serine protease
MRIITRHTLKTLLGLLIVSFSLSSTAALPSADGDGTPLPSLAKMLKNVNPAVVNIATFSEQQQYINPLFNDPNFRRFFNIPEENDRNSKRTRRKLSAGSGVIVDADKGIVMTNNHVVDGADEVRVSLVDGRHYTAEVVGTDPALDIAILKIKGENLAEVKLGESELLEVGDFVVAIGNPFNLGQTVTTGVVSALGRGINISRDGYENFIQTDASINRGNSGGALVDLRGRLIGINTAIVAPAGGSVGLGFAIPIDMAKASMEQILEFGEVNRGQIGVQIQNIDADFQSAFGLPNGLQGVVITKVQEDSPADDAGLRADDIILKVNGKKVISDNQLRGAIAKHKIGDKITIQVLRDGDKKRFKVEIGEPQTFSNSSKTHQFLNGATFEEDDNGDGVVIVSIQPNSQAAFNGLRTGDQIISVNKQRIRNLKDFNKVLKQDSNKILLKVKRGASVFYMIIR